MHLKFDEMWVYLFIYFICVFHLTRLYALSGQGF